MAFFACYLRQAGGQTARRTDFTTPRPLILCNAYPSGTICAAPGCREGESK